MSLKSITVIGSGINAYFFVKNIITKDIKVNLIDYTNEKQTNEVNEKSDQIFDNTSSPKIIIENFSKKIEDFKKLNNFQYNNFDAQSAVSLGGLSNVWGGTIYKFTHDELKKNNLDKLNLYDYYKFLDDDNLSIEESQYQPFFEKSVNKSECSIKYNNNLLSPNKSPFNVKKKFQELIKEKKINLIEGFVTKIIKKDKNYELLIKDKSKNQFVFKDECLVLAAGSISSARLLMDLMKKNTVKLLCTPLHRQVLFSSRRHKNNSLNAILSLTKKKQNHLSSHIFPLKGLKNKFFLDYLKINYNFLYPLMDFLKPNLYGMYTYFSSEYSNVTIEKNDKNYLIKGHSTKLNNYTLKNNFDLSVLKIPYTSKYLLQGSDNHLGGSFPLAKYFNELNELKDYKNLHVIDGTYLNYIPPLGYTLITILNAIRIAKSII